MSLVIGEGSDACAWLEVAWQQNAWRDGGCLDGGWRQAGLHDGSREHCPGLSEGMREAVLEHGTRRQCDGKLGGNAFPILDKSQKGADLLGVETEVCGFIPLVDVSLDEDLVDRRKRRWKNQKARPTYRDAGAVEAQTGESEGDGNCVREDGAVMRCDSEGSKGVGGHSELGGDGEQAEAEAELEAEGDGEDGEGQRRKRRVQQWSDWREAGYVRYYPFGRSKFYTDKSRLRKQWKKAVAQAMRMEDVRGCVCWSCGFNSNTKEEGEDEREFAAHKETRLHKMLEALGGRSAGGTGPTAFSILRGFRNKHPSSKFFMKTERPDPTVVQGPYTQRMTLTLGIGEEERVLHAACTHDNPIIAKHACSASLLSSLLEEVGEDGVLALTTFDSCWKKIQSKKLPSSSS